MGGNKVFGDRLKALRISMGLSLRNLGEKLNITAQTLSNYERGLTMPASPIVIALANEFKVKVEYFFRPVTVSIEGLDFRKKNSFLVKEQNSLVAEMQDWLERYKQVESLFNEHMSVVLPRIEPAATVDQIEQIAVNLRQEWNLGQAPIESMTSLLEENNIRVCLIDAADSFDACTFWSDGRPCIVARNNLPGDRLRFNLAHELGHLVIKCPEEGDKRTREKPAMRFASAFLAPSAVVKRELGLSRKKLGLNELHILKMKYGLSMSAWVFRAKDLGIISETAARGLFFVLKRYGKQEPGEPYPPEVPPTRMKQLVFRAYAEAMISEAKAAELLALSIYEFRREFFQP
ncbi:MAG: hypothetical protein GQF41_1539 [Candidatus Rifleibacterium amylolyticum]|nr:MAG: hypothetical protein GQF41_1539 [Candidatus Rifleibacterium amylolyticum]